MQYRLPTLLPGQFRLLALFTWTTLAAVALAIIRLPIPAAVKFLILTILWGFFRVWNMAKQPHTPAARIHNALLDVVGGMMFPVYLLSDMASLPKEMTSSYVLAVLGCIRITMCALLIALAIIPPIIRIRSELRHTKAAPKIDG